MEELIQRDIMSAMKEKNETKLTALRAVKTAIMQTKTSSTFKGDRESVLPDADVVKLMQKIIHNVWGCLAKSRQPRRM